MSYPSKMELNLEESSKNPNKSSFSIDCLLGRKENDVEQEEDVEEEEDVLETDIDVEQDEELSQNMEESLMIPMPHLVRPQPRIFGVGGSHGPFENLNISENSTEKEASRDPDEDAAIAAALQNSLFYSQHPSNFLYSQWLASRNTSALFGLQGKSTLNTHKILHLTWFETSFQLTADI